MINQIVLGDAKDLLQQIEPESIALVMTDPPYPKEFFHTYKYLAEFCPRLMQRGASLLVIAAHYSLENIMAEFRGKLKYRWLLNMDQSEGTHARMAMGIEVMWKPILWYVKEAYPQGRGFLRDMVKINGKDGQNKKLHKWQQDESWCEYYIERLTKPNDIVLDPYVGSGTVPFICKKLGRNFIGFDNDPEAVETAIQRLK